MPHRLTRQTRRLLEALLTAPTKDWYGLELMDLTKLSSGTMYPLLHRLQQDGWLAAAQEEIDPVQAGRPRRRLYRLTGSGEAAARQLIATRDPSRLSNRPTAAVRPGVAST
jgi:PadR family transcriptional regulator PadR